MVAYGETRAVMKELGLRPSWTNATLVAEALERGVEVSAVEYKPRIVFRHQGEVHRWQGGRTTLNSPLARVIGLYKDLQSRMFLNLDPPMRRG